MLKMNRKTIREHEQQKKNQRAPKSKQIEEEMATFYQNEAVPRPGKNTKKLVSRKSGLTKSVLQKPVAEYHRKYQEEGGQASFSHFAKCRPSSVRRIANSGLN